MKIKRKLHSTLRSHCEKLRSTATILSPSGKGCLNYELLSFYILNLEFLFKNNIETLQKAAERYKTHACFGPYFQSKWAEEKGHDAWARSDLKKLLSSYPLAEEPRVLPEMVDFISYLSNTMETNPLLYVTYSYHAEFLTSYLGPEWMRLINTSLGVSASEVTALSKHIELDGDHADEVADFIESLNPSAIEVEQMISFTNVLHEGYFHFFEALAKVGKSHERKSSRKSA